MSTCCKSPTICRRRSASAWLAMATTLRRRRVSPRHQPNRLGRRSGAPARMDRAAICAAQNGNAPVRRRFYWQKPDHAAARSGEGARPRLARDGDPARPHADLVRRRRRRRNAPPPQRYSQASRRRLERPRRLASGRFARRRGRAARLAHKRTNSADPDVRHARRLYRANSRRAS